MIAYLGCYTDEAHPNGLEVIELDEATGAMSVAARYPVTNALYLALSPDGKRLYTCTGEGLASFAVADGARLERVDAIGLGDCVCHISLLPRLGRCAFADYAGGFAGSVALDDGRFGEVAMHRHCGCGPNLPRQDKAHCHQACPLPDGSGYVVCDLGMDELVEYPSLRRFRTSPAGAGPRHVVFHPDGRLAFLVSELGNLVASLSWTPAAGFRQLDALSTLANPGAYNLAAAIRFSPDGRDVVVSNRGENSLAVFDFDKESGRLAAKATTMLSGDWPRDFIFIGQSLALVACERSGEVLSFRYNPESGAFFPLASLRGLFRPVAIAARSIGNVEM